MIFKNDQLLKNQKKIFSSLNSLHNNRTYLSISNIGKAKI